MPELRMTRAKALAISLGLTCTEVAIMAHAGRADTNVVLNGGRVPGKKLAAKIAGALEWDGEPEELFEVVTYREAE